MISIIIPFFNEKENLSILIKELKEVLKNINQEWELVLVNDGSTDGWENNLSKFLNKENQGSVKFFSHRKRLGKGNALKTGIKNAKGEVLVFMDADLQDDPKDLRNFLEKINEGFDFVNGARKKRQDNFLIKTYSKIAGFILKKFFQSPFSDINCGFKAFKKEVVKDFVFYGNNFRFFPLWIYYQGFRVTEIDVKNNRRKFGKSKFGSGKIFIGLIDLLTTYFIFKFSEKPLHFFGTIGGFLLSIGGMILFYLMIERIFFKELLYRRPVLFLGILLVIIGIQIIMTGIIAELIVYFENKKNK